MSRSILVQIVGAPIACKDGIKDSWRSVTAWADRQLHAQFGENVQVKYYDLFDPGCPRMPENAQLPLVLVQGEVISVGGKISVPMIRQKIEILMNKETV